MAPAGKPPQGPPMLRGELRPRLAEEATGVHRDPGQSHLSGVRMDEYRQARGQLEPRVLHLSQPAQLQAPLPARSAPRASIRRQAGRSASAHPKQPPSMHLVLRHPHRPKAGQRSQSKPDMSPSR